MQAGFPLLEAGLTRMKTTAYAAKNVLIFALASVIYFAVDTASRSAMGATAWSEAPGSCPRPRSS